MGQNKFNIGPSGLNLKVVGSNAKPTEAERLAYEAYAQKVEKERQAKSPTRRVLSSLLGGAENLFGDTVGSFARGFTGIGMDENAPSLFSAGSGERAGDRPRGLREISQILGETLGSLENPTKIPVGLAGLPFLTYRARRMTKGQPPIIHGTQSPDFTNFDAKFNDKNDLMGNMFNAAERPDYADKYAYGMKRSGGNSRVIPIEPQAKNVLDVVDPIKGEDLAAVIAAVPNETERRTLKNSWKERYQNNRSYTTLDPTKEYGGPESLITSIIDKDRDILGNAGFDAFRHRDGNEQVWGIPDTTQIKNSWGVDMSSPNYRPSATPDFNWKSHSGEPYWESPNLPVVASKSVPVPSNKGFDHSFGVEPKIKGTSDPTPPPYSPFTDSGLSPQEQKVAKIMVSSGMSPQEAIVFIKANKINSDPIPPSIEIPSNSPLVGLTPEQVDGIDKLLDYGFPIDEAKELIKLSPNKLTDDQITYLDYYLSLGLSTAEAMDYVSGNIYKKAGNMAKINAPSKVAPTTKGANNWWKDWKKDEVIPTNPNIAPTTIDYSNIPKENLFDDTDYSSWGKAPSIQPKKYLDFKPDFSDSKVDFIKSLGGYHGAQLLDIDGLRKVFKPGPNQGLPAIGEEFGTKIANYLNAATPIATRGEVPGYGQGTIQSFKPGSPLPKNLDDLSNYEQGLIQSELPVDWLVGNHDAHVDQFVKGQNTDNIYPIDKGQSFKYWNEEKLSPNYNPNKKYGERNPVYTFLGKNVDPSLEGQMAQDILYGKHDGVLNLAEQYAKERLLIEPNFDIQKFMQHMNNKLKTLPEGIESYWKETQNLSPNWKGGGY